MNAEQQDKVWGQIVARAWADAAFKRRLLTEPATVLSENGMEVPAGVGVKVVDDTDKGLHLTLSAQPAGESPEREQAMDSTLSAQLAQEQLDHVAGGLVLGDGSVRILPLIEQDN
jgi:hypothetical protein